jgi:hypothetical protein
MDAKYIVGLRPMIRFHGQDNKFSCSKMAWKLLRSERLCGSSDAEQLSAVTQAQLNRSIICGGSEGEVEM